MQSTQICQRQPGRVASVVALAVRSRRKTSVQCGEPARRVEKLGVARSPVQLDQLAPGADVIFIAAGDTASQPAAHDSMHEAERRGIAERVAGREQPAQRDRLAETPDPVVPAHRDCRDGADLLACHACSSRISNRPPEPG